MAKVTFKRIESSEDIDDIVVVDGQLIFTKDGKQYLDYGNERIDISSGGGGDTFPIVNEYSTDTDNAYSTRYINNRLIELIGDLAELTTTDDDNIVDAINELNSQKSSKSNILWTNATPTSSVAGGTRAPLNSDDYDYIIWIYCYNTNPSNTNIHKSSICLKGSSVMMNIVGYTTGISMRRIADYVDDTTYTFRDAYNDTTVNNDYCIPLYAIGGKF